MTARPRTKTARTAPAIVEALVRRVVAGVVEVGGADRPARRGVEQDEIGVAPDLDGALAREAEQAGRGRGEQVDQPLDGEAALGDALGVDDRQERLDAGRAVR